MDTTVAATAIGPMVIAAVDQCDEHPLVRDVFAAGVLPTSGRLAAAAARWRPVRNAIVAATKKKVPGLWASMLCRKLVFTFMRKNFLDGSLLFGGEAAREFVVKRRMRKCGLLPAHVAEFVAAYGWAEAEQLGPEEFTERYVAPSGRSLPVPETERTARCIKVADR